jgi:hypothetical protein
MKYYVAIFGGGPYILGGRQCVIVNFASHREARNFAQECDGELLKRTAHVSLGQKVLCVKNVAVPKRRAREMISNLSSVGIISRSRPAVEEVENDSNFR